MSVLYMLQQKKKKKEKVKEPMLVPASEQGSYYPSIPMSVLYMYSSEFPSDNPLRAP